MAIRNATVTVETTSIFHSQDTGLALPATPQDLPSAECWRAEVAG